MNVSNKAEPYDTVQIMITYARLGHLKEVTSVTSRLAVTLARELAEFIALIGDLWDQTPLSEDHAAQVND